MPKLDIKKPCYALASVDGKSAELMMYGNIYEKQPIDPYTGKPRTGKFILLDEFLEDLKRIEGCKSLTVRMNSYGGDAGVSNTIHNRLRELSRNGVKTTCIVDGVAMSGGSLIMCGCDVVKANPSSLIMIHKAWTFLFGGYNADEMRQMAEQNDAWDRMQSEIYQRKTGLSNAVVLHMMSDTTYMTGREAKDKGFVDEVLEDAAPAQIAASADGRSLYVYGHTLHLAPGMFAPDFIPTAEEPGERIAAAPAELRNDTTGSPAGDGGTGRLISGATGCEEDGGTHPLREKASPTEVNTAGAEAAADETNTNSPGDAGGNEGGTPMNQEELRRSEPELVREIEAAAVRAERERLSSIDEIAAQIDPALVREAKYGDVPCTAAELALRAMKAAAQTGSRYLAAARADAEESGADSVPAAPGAEETGAGPKNAEEKLNRARAAVREMFEGKEE